MGVPLQLSRREDHRPRHVRLSSDWDEPPHQSDQLRGEQRILLAHVHANRQFLATLNFHEPDILEFTDEDTLRQGAG